MIQERIRFLDFARGYAILSIVLFHALIPIAHGIGSSIIQFGGAGVHAFVLLSGFGLSMTTLQRSLAGFYGRRFRRVLVPYFVFVTILYLINIIWPIYPGRGLRAYLGHVLLFKMFDESIISSYGHHLWFLSTIIQLYLAFPVLFRVMQRWGGRRFLGLTCLISFAFSIYVVVSGRSHLRTFNSCGVIYLWEFALGMVLAARYLHSGERFWEVPLGRLLPLTAIGLVVQAILSIRGGPIGQILNNPASLVGYGGTLIVVYRLCQVGMLQWIDMAIRWLGNVAYELYLVHSFVVTRVYWTIDPETWLTALFVALTTVACAVVVASAYHRILVEITREARLSRRAPV